MLKYILPATNSKCTPEPLIHAESLNTVPFSPITVLYKELGVRTLLVFHLKFLGYWLNTLVLILAFSQVILTFLNIYRRVLLVSKIQIKGTSATALWDNLDFEEKVKFIDMWVIFTTIGNISQILGCTNILIVGNATLSINEAVLGMGCFCSWITILQFLKPSTHSYTVIDTLSRSFSRLVPYICGILPIFMAFVFLAMCLFWESGNYTSVTLSMVVAFCMLNGDTLDGFMTEAISVNGFFGQLYMYAFLVFFIW